MDKRLSIAFPFSGTLVGGSCVFAAILAKELEKVGHNPIVLLPALGPNSELFERLSLKPIYYGLPIKHVEEMRDTKAIFSKLLSLRAHITTYQIALKVLKRTAPDIVHVNDDHNMFNWGLAAKRLGIPVVWHLHQRSGSAVLDQFRLRLADYLIYITEDTKGRFKGIKNLPPGKVVYNPVDINCFHPTNNKAQIKAEFGIPNDAVSIGYVGNFVDRKRPEWLVEIVEELLQQGLPVCGVIAGSDLSGGRYTTRLKGIIEATGHPERFVFLGYHPDIVRVMNSIDILVLPSKAESFGRVVIEAMACEVAVVATNAGGVPEIIHNGENGFLTSPEDIKEMIEKVRYLCTKSKKRERLCKLARKRVVEKFTLEATIKPLLEIYTKLTGEGQ